MSNTNYNTNRRILINNYLNLIDENNTNITQLINLMNNQESTLRRLIFDTEPVPRTPHTPLFNNYMNNRLTRNVGTTNNSMNTNTSTNTNTNTNLNANFTSLNRPRDRYLDSLVNIDNIIETFLDNVPVIPTTEQISNATRHCIFSEIDEPMNSTCPIALRRFEDDDEVTVIRYCNHVFLRDDLSSWFRSNTRCPLCRYDIRTYVNQVN